VTEEASAEPLKFPSGFFKKAAQSWQTNGHPMRGQRVPESPVRRRDLENLRSAYMAPPPGKQKAQSEELG